ncbi:MAG: hypothetical protein R6V02_09960 [Candidatus Aminicenantes bacterium]
MRKKAGLAVIICILAVGFLSAQNGTEPIRTSDLLKLKTMSRIDISPDGKHAVFVLTSMGKNSKEEFRYFRHL